MVNDWVVPELGTNFTYSFSKMLIGYIYNNWSYTTGNLAKPATMQGQTNIIEFRTGLYSDFKDYQVLTLQGPTRRGLPNGQNPNLQIGQKHISFLTQVNVTFKVISIELNEPDLLYDMEKELVRILGQYNQADQSGDMRGIKDLFFDQGERQITVNEEFDKSDWRSIWPVTMWYTLQDVSS